MKSYETERYMLQRRRGAIPPAACNLACWGLPFAEDLEQETLWLPRGAYLY